jgi:hypothetical protein
MTNGDFIRIIYSTGLISLNGICIILPFKILGTNKYYNKCKYEIELTTELEQIKIIETDILQKVNIRGKIPQHNIYEHLSGGHVKTICECDDPKSIVLKISGIWETDAECGITYKFIMIPSLSPSHQTHKL